MLVTGLETGEGGRPGSWCSVGESEAGMVGLGAGSSRGSAAPGTRLARAVGGLTRSERGQLTLNRSGRCNQDIVSPHK